MSGARLTDKRLIVVGGKGGVGRTTAAAALALATARRGKRVLLAQARSKDRLAALFGVGAVGTELVEVETRLWVTNMSPQAALREYGTMVLRSEFVARQVLENRLARGFLHAVPGLEDYSMLGKVWYHTTEKDDDGDRWDQVVLDGPATGHLIGMLKIPQAILEAIPEGPMTRPAEQARDLLRDPARTALVIVTLAEELPTSETLELAARAQRELGVPLGPVLVNQLYPPLPVGAVGQALAALRTSAAPLAAIAPLVTVAQSLAKRRALNEEHLGRLRAELPVPQLHLPFLFAAALGRPELETLADRLAPQLDAVAR